MRCVRSSVRPRAGRLALAGCLGLLFAAAPGPARAWTDARVVSADAHVDVSASGRALVRLSLQLEVRAGYLSSFELSGLDPNLTLDRDKPPSLLTEDGRKARAQPELRPDGSLLLTFTRADAPRRGRHQLELLYFTQLASAEPAAGRPGLSFALPAFRFDLEDVDLWINAPPGTGLAAPRDGAPEYELSRMPLAPAARSVLHVHRAHLPRTLALGVELLLPAARTSRPVPAAAKISPDSEPGALWLATAVLVLALLKLIALGASGKAASSAAQLLVPLPHALRVALMLLLAAAGALLYPRQPVLGLLPLAAVVSLAFGRPAAQRAAARRFDRLQRLFSTACWLDATTPPGVALLASGYLLVLCGSQIAPSIGPTLELLLLATPLFLTGTRRHAPRLPERTPLVELRSAALAAEIHAVQTANAPAAPLSPKNAGAARPAPDRAA